MERTRGRALAGYTLAWTGTDPVVLTSDAALNVRTGEEVDIIPEHLLFPDLAGILDRDAYPHLDTGGAVVAEEPDGDAGPLLLHRTNAAGEVVDVTEPTPGLPVDDWTVLEDVLVGTAGVSAVLVADPGGTVAADGLRRIDLEGTERRRWLHTVPVPGAVVAHASADDEDGGGLGPVVVNGLVP